MLRYYQPPGWARLGVLFIGYLLLKDFLAWAWGVLIVIGQGVKASWKWLKANYR